MRKILLLSISIILFSVGLSAQTLFQKAIFSSGYMQAHGVINANGGYAIVGEAMDSSGNFGIYIAKTNSNGQMLWNKLFYKSNSCVFEKVIATSDGGFLLSGFMYSAASDSVIIVKTDGNGNIDWSKNFFKGTGICKTQAMLETTNGDFVIAGSYELDSVFNSQNIFALRINSNGGLIWARGYSSQLFSVDYFGDVIQTADDGFMFFARTALNTEGSWLMKTNATGIVQWTHQYKTSTAELFACFPKRLYQHTDGSYYLIHTQSFSFIENQCFIIHTDSAGNYLGTKRFDIDLADSVNSIINNVEVIDNNYFLLSGSYMVPEVNYNSDALMLKVDIVTGNILWSCRYGSPGYEEAKDAIGTADGNCLFVGATQKDSLFRGGIQTDIYFTKTNADGLTACNMNSVPAVSSTVNFNDSINTIFGFGISTTIGYTNSLFDVSSVYNDSTACVGVGMGNTPAQIADYKIYPNPATDELIVETADENSNSNIQIADALGRIIFERKNINKSESINLKSISDGMYFIQIFSDKNSFKQKVIVLH